MEKKAKNLRNGKLVKDILLFFAMAPVVGAATVFFAAAPGFGIVLKEFVDWYQKQNKSRRQQIRKTFKQIRRQRFVEEREINGKTTIVLSESGQGRVLEYKLDEMEIEPMIKWDGTWRIIVFDIPEKQKKAREAVRAKLKLWGCYPLQKSIFVTPHKCRDEIDFLAEIFRISPYIRLIEAESFDGVEDIKRFFNLS